MRTPTLFKFSARIFALILIATLTTSACSDDNDSIDRNDRTEDKADGSSEDPDTGTDDTDPDIGQGCVETNGGVESCDGLDNDCNGLVDDQAAGAVGYYVDSDGDGFGDDGAESLRCEAPQSGYATVGGDCDDTDAAVNPDAAEVCDGVDNNCDTQIDSGAQACALQDGVCSGAMATTCDGDSYAACTTNDYGPEFSEADDEDRRCDGLDNNCDGIVDNVCCGVAGNNSEPDTEIFGVGNDYGHNASSNSLGFGLSSPTLIAAASSAPAGATSLMVWEESRTRIWAQHLDQDGKAVGTKYGISVVEATASTVVATPQGYDLIWGESYQPENGPDFTRIIKVQPLTSSLSESGSTLTVLNKTESVHELTTLSAAYSDRGVIIGETGLTLGPKVGALMYRIDDRENSIETLELGNGNLFGSVKLRTFAMNSGLLVTWYTGGGLDNSPKLRGKLYSSTGVASGSFEVSYEEQTDEQFDIIQTGDDEIMVVFGEKRGSNKALVAATINISSNAKVDKIDLTDSIASNDTPSVADLDTDGDGYADKTTIVWVREGTNSTALVGSSFDAQNPGLLLDPSIIAPDVAGVDNTGIALTTHSAVATWQTRVGTQRVKTAPLSLEGHGVCP